MELHTLYDVVSTFSEIFFRGMEKFQRAQKDPNCSGGINNVAEEDLLKHPILTRTKKILGPSRTAKGFYAYSLTFFSHLRL